ncbi:hypothetical protein CYMTET_11225, partial [Cymbomonas tetramitiformis]
CGGLDGMTLLVHRLWWAGWNDFVGCGELDGMTFVDAQAVAVVSFNAENASFEPIIHQQICPERVQWIRDACGDDQAVVKRLDCCLDEMRNYENVG